MKFRLCQPWRLHSISWPATKGLATSHVDGLPVDNPAKALLLHIQSEECIQVADEKASVRQNGAGPGVLPPQRLESTDFFALGRAGLDNSQFATLSKNNESV